MLRIIRSPTGRIRRRLVASMFYVNICPWFGQLYPGIASAQTHLRRSVDVHTLYAWTCTADCSRNSNTSPWKPTPRGRSRTTLLTKVRRIELSTGDPACRRQEHERLHIIMDRQAHLFKVVGALHCRCEFASACTAGDQQADQNSNNCDDDRELDESKPTGRPDGDGSRSDWRRRSLCARPRRSRWATRQGY